MNAIWIFIGVPLFISGVLLFLRNCRNVSVFVALISSFILAVLSFLLPLDESISLGGTDFIIDRSYALLGRVFSVGAELEPIVSLIWIMAFFWLMIAAFCKRSRYNFGAIPAISALLLASLTSQVFIYSCLIIFILALFGAVVLISNSKNSRGALLLITYQTIALPVLLLMDWGLSRLDGLLPSENEAVIILGLMSVGFAIWLAVLPFHALLPLLGEETKPISFLFIISSLNLVVSLHFIKLLFENSWILTHPVFLNTTTIIGVLVIGFAGVNAAVQNNAGRMAGYLLLGEVGYFLLSLTTINSTEGIETFWMLMIGRITLFLLLTLALTYISNLSEGDLSFSKIKGIIRNPLVISALLLVFGSFAGLPFSAGFPVKSMIWIQLMGSDHANIVFLLMLGGMGVLVGGFRVMANLTSGYSDETHNTRALNSMWKIGLGVGIVTVVFFGIFPQVVSKIAEGLSGVFIFPG